MLSKPNPSSTILYSSASEMESHIVRFIMAEKNIEREVANLKTEEIPEEILDLMPYPILPTLFDRNIVLYDLSVIMEYLDERFPFPPLLPVDPIEKSEKRLLIFRFTRAVNSWFELANTIETGTKKDADNARKTLKSSLIELVPLFAHQPFFKSNDMTIVDACLAVLLWRLKRLDIDLGKSGKAVTDYASRLFSRESFKESLTDCEKEYNA
ncbi:Stringent starvation protein A [uncultured Gammaproteobacteria bacterium]|jgi:RNA polymerase-associated protein|uniref:Stringent starvation protein A n=3 Tax=sulfur-oxidizing symbionts TaxID=32036 RepID=A0ACA8ZRG5_9GAMM|nr:MULTISPECIES: glutathione binding-like protein [sulfur-oxidizing symbionts]CAC5839399.1 Stringent starvation protein A [uncultured Gammaproteobacteria bacterium]CAB5503798.1 Stringent starvation protein A [Bathymodiolus azoricus thioautotrophic gill symbiont]CAB5508338.1 Stringent starvation protein A [Bathymodiolus thermophilus thioautotrophic gill symbiont]CAC9511739.1 Stringent starvation protein A [uncultured Gammaproteobacteria bacterium]CAC9512893.1 Stringent starvation protein A [unc